ncbi:MAG: flagellin, partial [Lachnospiraceae bacterium]|nr:flagellin [Lachnospiraceae bacterium]
SNRMLGVTTSAQAKSTEKLSSGYKINRAADDAAGLSISEKMRKQIRGLTQASDNAQDGISAVQTAEGALTEVHDMLQRMNELAVKSSNESNSEDDRKYIQDEINQLVDEIDRVAETTKFNETYLLKGDKNAAKSKVYDYVPSSTTTKLTATSALFDICGNTITNAVAEEMRNKGEKLYKTATTATSATATDMSAASTAKVDLYDKAGHMIAKKDDILSSAVIAGITNYFTDTKGAVKASSSDLTLVTVAKGDLFRADGTIAYTSGAIISATDQTNIASLNTSVTPGSVAEEGTDYTYDVNTYTGQLYDKDGNKIAKNGLENYFEQKGADLIYKGGLYTEGGVEVGVKDKPLTLTDNKDLVNYVTTSDTGTGALELSLHVGADSTDNNQISLKVSAMDAKTLGIDGIRVDGADDTNARNAIDTVKAAIQRVSTQRSSLGAVQNRLEHTINNLDNIVENTTAAESQIRDTDMATEMVKYSKNNILAQAGQSMLAQANQANQGVLSLLQ